MRIIGGQLEDADALNRLQKMRPRPSNYIAWGTTSQLTDIYEKAKAKDMVKRDSQWTLVQMDFGSEKFPANLLKDPANIFTLDQSACCKLLESSGNVLLDVQKPYLVL